MDVLTTALELALISRHRFAISTGSSLPYLKAAVSAHGLTVQEVDLYKSRDDLLSVLDRSSQGIEVSPEPSTSQATGLSQSTAGSQISSESHSITGSGSIPNVLILRNVQKVSLDHHKEIYEWLDAMDNKHRKEKLQASRLKHSDLLPPPLFTIILVVNFGKSKPKVYPYLKGKFLFSINCHKEFERLDEIKSLQTNQYDKDLTKLLHATEHVFVHPDIHKFIYTLVVLSRNHRLTSLASRTSRLPTFALDYTLQLAVALVVWKSRDLILSKSGLRRRLFVTPDFAKLAFRKVAYWHIDWETDLDNKEDDYLRSLELNMLSGDWYGSDYKYVKDYIQESRGVRDDSSPTGYTNRIVDDTIEKASPPM